MALVPERTYHSSGKVPHSETHANACFKVPEPDDVGRSRRMKQARTSNWSVLRPFDHAISGRFVAQVLSPSRALLDALSPRRISHLHELMGGWLLLADE